MALEARMISASLFVGEIAACKSPCPQRGAHIKGFSAVRASAAVSFAAAASRRRWIPPTVEVNRFPPRTQRRIKRMRAGGMARRLYARSRAQFAEDTPRGLRTGCASRDEEGLKLRARINSSSTPAVKIPRFAPPLTDQRAYGDAAGTMLMTAAAIAGRNGTFVTSAFTVFIFSG